MTYESDLLDLDRPCVHQLFEQRRDGSAVFRNVQTGVVAQVYGGAAEIGGQARAVGIAGMGAAQIPVELVPHQAVQEHD